MTQHGPVEDDGGPRLSFKEAAVGMPRGALIAVVGSGLIIAVALFVAIRALAGQTSPAASLVPVVAVAVLVPLVTRSSFKAWRAGYSPVPRLRARERFATNYTVDEALARAKSAALSMPRCKAESLRLETSTMTIDTGLSGPSWGERISVCATTAEDGRTKVDITSRPLFRANVFDSGTNERNVRVIATRIRGLGDR